MAKHYYPRKGDHVIDTYLTNKRREGIVQKILYIQDDEFIEVEWINAPYGALPEQLEYASCFTQENCGNGRWDEKQNAWIIEMQEGEEFLPVDDPFTISLNKGFEEINKQLVIKRLGIDSKLPSYQLLLKSCELRKEANLLGTHHSQFNHYFFLAEDYAKMAAYKQDL